MDEALNVREFWFGKEPLSAEALRHLVALWFTSDDPDATRQRDELIAERFATLLERAASGALAGWATSPRRCLSLIIVLDQFPRHIFRGTARAFAYDEQALALTLFGMQSAADGALNAAERIFFYMPLQHCESLEVQEESVAAYRRLLVETPDELRFATESALESARTHRELIRHFGRFPHRNAMLRRNSTPEEKAYLAEEADRFGQ